MDFLRRSSLGTDGMGKFVAMAMNKTTSTPRTRGAASAVASWMTHKTVTLNDGWRRHPQITLSQVELSSIQSIHSYRYDDLISSLIELRHYSFQVGEEGIYLIQPDQCRKPWCPGSSRKQMRGGARMLMMPTESLKVAKPCRKVSVPATEVSTCSVMMLQYSKSF